MLSAEEQIDGGGRLGRGRGGGGRGGERLGGWGAGRVGPGSGYRGVTCRSLGSVEIVSEKLQTFRSKEYVRREFVGKDWWVWAKIVFCGQKEIFVGKEKCIIRGGPGGDNSSLLDGLNADLCGRSHNQPHQNIQSCFLKYLGGGPSLWERVMHTFN